MPSTDEDVKERELSNFVSGNEKWYSHTLLVEMKNDAATLENRMAAF